MTLVAETLIAALIVFGAAFLFVGSLGLSKLPDLMRRLHAPTKATTLGIGSLLIASMLYFAAVQGAPSLHEVLITLFLFLTAPVTAHMLSKAYILTHPNVQETLPSVATGWATLRPPPAARDAENGNAP